MLLAVVESLRADLELVILIENTYLVAGICSDVLPEFIGYGYPSLRINLCIKRFAQDRPLDDPCLGIDCISRNWYLP